MIRPYRQELKFVVHHSAKTLILERWRRYLRKAPFTNRHAVTPILSQYYDSPDLAFYREKLDGVPLRNKVRLRVYDLEFRQGATAFLEIKHRDNDRVKKFRYKIPDFRESHLDLDRWLPDCVALEGAFHILFQRCRLRPSVQVYYQREAYEGVVESDVRVTFDTNLTGLYPGERLTSCLLNDRSRQLMPDTLQILEVKATHGIPNWLQEGVLAAELQAATIPKYITAVELLGLPEHNPTGVYAWNKRRGSS
ncbi:MAG: polyphosphate polymerase domain-containing protein [Gemmatimonadetes bacterium]|nr:MAG: polyphosphate polymerase domain-containing protein [Gemmatimonadota bacterium]